MEIESELIGDNHSRIYGDNSDIFKENAHNKLKSEFNWINCKSKSLWLWVKHDTNSNHLQNKIAIQQFEKKWIEITPEVEEYNYQLGEEDIEDNIHNENAEAKQTPTNYNFDPHSWWIRHISCRELKN